MVLRQRPPGLYEESTIRDINGFVFVRAQEDIVLKLCRKSQWFRELAVSCPAGRSPIVIDKSQSANTGDLLETNRQSWGSSPRGAGKVGSCWQRVGGGFWHIIIERKATLDEQMDLAAFENKRVEGEPEGETEKEELEVDSSGSSCVEAAGAASQPAEGVALQLVAYRRQFPHSRGRPARQKRQQTRHGTDHVMRPSGAHELPPI